MYLVFVALLVQDVPKTYAFFCFFTLCGWQDIKIQLLTNFAFPEI